MTVTTSAATGEGAVERRPDLVTVTIDGFDVHVPPGTLVIRAAELIGIQIPRFCDHPLLDPVGACRQCLVEIEGQRKPLASCTTHVTDGMVVKTQLSSPVADKAQQGVMELLLINHPLDCPVCDKGGECPLQNQAMSNGRPESRFTERKRTFPKPINISAQVLLDRERCVLCARCTRFSQQVAGDPFIEMFERGALQQVAVYQDKPFESYFAGNTIQICPVGALTSAAYRFRSRPFDLVSSPTTCEHCASGCALRTDHRRGKVMRRLAWDDPAVNEEWNCDKGRFAFTYATRPDRLTMPLVRDEEGSLVPASWREAVAIAAERLAAARGGTGVLTGGRLTVEDAYGYAKFARTVLGTNDIDCRARPHSAEEAEFLATAVAGHGVLAGEGPTYDDLEAAPVVLLVGFEPEEESPIVFLRLRKAVRRRRMAVYSIAPFASNGLQKLAGTVLPAVPGAEPDVLAALTSLASEHPGEFAHASSDAAPVVAQALRQEGAVILVGERLASVPGGFAAVAGLAASSGARLAWIPRRAGERGAVEAGALPNLLPGGRPVNDPAGRRELAAAWGVDTLPEQPGRDTAGIVAAAAGGQLGALVVAGVDVDDLPDPLGALVALETVPFLVSLELRASEVTERADVVFPVPPVAEKAGTFVDWEGRLRPFEQALRGAPAMTDLRVLDAIAEEMDRPFGLRDAAAAKAELVSLVRRTGPGGAPGNDTEKLRDHGERETAGAGEAVLATWRLLLDLGRMQDGEPYLARTARSPVVRLSAATAAEIGARDGDLVVVSTDRGTVTLPLAVTDMLDRVVWLPAKSPGCAVYRDLGVEAGAVVRIGVGSTT
jgi:NADH-quinone oxidoreductase subunit G